MKGLVIFFSIFILQINTQFVCALTSNIIVVKKQKLDIKIKNDTNEDKEVINTSSGGRYKLAKNAITTIKMSVGDKLYLQIKGKKTNLLLTASYEVSTTVQLFSSLIK